MSSLAEQRLFAFQQGLKEDSFAISAANQTRISTLSEERMKRKRAFLKQRAILNDRKFQAAFKPLWMPPVPQLPVASLTDASPSENFVKNPLQQGIYGHKSLQPPHNQHCNFKFLQSSGKFFSLPQAAASAATSASVVPSDKASAIPQQCWTPVQPGGYFARPEFDELGPLRIPLRLKDKICVPTRTLDDSLPNFCAGTVAGSAQSRPRAKSTASDAKRLAALFASFRRVGIAEHARGSLCFVGSLEFREGKKRD